MQRNLILALHGFLGLGSDWDQVINEFNNSRQSKVDQWDWLTPDLFAPGADWLAPFDRFCEALIQKYEAVLLGSNKRLFLGYSLGGRLGLHCLKNYADCFDYFIFVSTHPGLTNEAEKDKRRIVDREWAQEISLGHWSKFLKKWNSQNIFLKSRTNVTGDRERLLSNYNIMALQSSLNIWSLAEQQDLRDLIKKYQHKILWVVGDQDQKFSNIADELKQKKILLNISRISSGHRALIENPKELARLLHQLG